MIRYIYILTLLLSLSYNATHFLKVNHSEDVKLDFENRSLQYLEKNKSLFGINNLQEELIIRDISIDNHGVHHLTLQQLYNGLPVLYSFVKVHTNIQGKISSISSDFLPGINISTKTFLSSEDAQRIARKHMDSTPVLKESTELVIFSLGVESILVYKVDLGSYPISKSFLVNAQTGVIEKEIILTFEEGPTVGYGITNLGEEIFELNIYKGTSFYNEHDFEGNFPPHPTDTTQFYLVDESNIDLGRIFTVSLHRAEPTNFLEWIYSPTDSFAISEPDFSHKSGTESHHGIRRCLDYFKSVHNLDGVDNNGRILGVIVDIDDCNAYYNLEIDLLSFGAANGNCFSDSPTLPYSSDLDIVGHEFGHGITGYSSGLIYEHQSGALNESLSDMFGFIVEAFYYPNQDEEHLWLLGEQMFPVPGGDSGFLRDLAHPPNGNQPDHINHEYYQNGGDDNGGVHTNSGIPNKVFYLLVEGGEHYGINIDPLDQDWETSLAIAAEIVFIWNTQYLTPEDNFITASTKMLMGISDHYPDNYNYYYTVSNAWLSVGVDVYEPTLEISSVEFNDQDDFNINPGETVEVTIQLINISMNEAQGISGTFSCEESITVIDGEISFDIINSGYSNSSGDSLLIISISEDIELGNKNCLLNISMQNQDGIEYNDEYIIEIDVSLNQAGFPVSTAELRASPLVIDLDNDGDVEIIAGDNNGFVHIYNADGSEVEDDTFPYDTGNQIWGSAAAADMDGDGMTDFVITSKSKHLYIFDQNGLKTDYNADKYLMGTPAIGNLDEDSDLEVVIGGYSSPTSSSPIFAVNPDGSDVEGFPLILGEKTKAGAALADFNGNGKDDIVVGTDSNNIYLIYDDGSIAPGFPYTTGDQIQAPPSIQEINGEKVIFSGSNDSSFYAIKSDGSLLFSVTTGDKILSSPSFLEQNGQVYIFFGSNDDMIYAVDGGGNALSGWPVAVNGSIGGSVVFSDVDGDNTAEVIAATDMGDVLALHLDGSNVEYFPISNGFPFSGSPMITNLDEDGDLEILAGSGGNLFVIDVKEPGNQSNYWSMFRGNKQRSGTYIPSDNPECGADLGDVTGDGNINILDLVQISNYILDISVPAYECATDFTQDGNVNILDLVQIANYILDN